MKKILTAVIVLSALFGCVTEDELPDTQQGNFEALWKIIDERYCYFDYKQHEYGLDWNSVRTKYAQRVDSHLSTQQLFEVLTDMLSELRDGHVNLRTAFDYGRYWAWKENYPANFSDTLQRKYLGTDYRIAAGLTYRILDDNIGYIYYGSFTSAIGEGNLDEVFNHLLTCNGLIVDIRDNGGGELTNAEKLAARFCNQRTLVGYLCHKTGTGHSDFSDMEPQYIEPSGRMRWQKNTVVLTNRGVFSAANEFVKYMKCFPNVKIVGDKTGGGGGLPFSSTLPCGWTVRLSACPMYDAQRRDTEFGIEPDYHVSLTDDDFTKGRDTIIEFARKLLAE
jgi:hypothetical protein